jgi:hypothetical protein
VSGIDVYRNPDEDIREAEQRDAELERREAPTQERGHGEGANDGRPEGEPSASDEEMSEDNDGGPPAG